MKKLNLDIDTLAVDSFATGNEAAMRGTMHGHAAQDTFTCLTGMETRTCPVVGTCVACAAEA
jgi:hypothetical protein